MLFTWSTLALTGVALAHAIDQSIYTYINHEHVTSHIPLVKEEYLP